MNRHRHARGRPFDIVLFGATGFTGALTAEYLARSSPEDCRWALAGRNPGKLRAVRARLAGIDPRLAELPLLHADVTDQASVRTVAESALVVATTVGPYIEHGEPLVAACADTGTDYVDLTGEPEFVDRMYLAHHARAVETGARIVHACGFDSVPHDLGAWFTVQQLPEGVPLRVRAMVRAGGRPSGGTLATLMAALSRPGQARQAAAARKTAEVPPAGRRVRAVARRPHRDPATGWWLVPLPTLDPLVVMRSASALDRYGPDFEYAHYAAVRRLPVLVAGTAAVAALFGAAQLPPLRRALLRQVPPGRGPREERRAESWFAVRFLGEGGGHRVVTQVSGGDPGYEETAKMLGESALCLAFDDNPAVSGSVTTAAAMAERLLDRLVTAGIVFEVLGSA